MLCQFGSKVLAYLWVTAHVTLAMPFFPSLGPRYTMGIATVYPHRVSAQGVNDAGRA